MITIQHRRERLFQPIDQALGEVFAPPGQRQARTRPAFSLYIAEGETIDFSPVWVCFTPYAQRFGKRSPHRGKRCLVEAGSLPPRQRRFYQRVGYIKAGFMIDCCQPFVLRALARNSSPWCAYPEKDIVLAVAARSQLHALAERVAREYARQMAWAHAHSLEESPHAILPERSTRLARHACGYRLLLHTLYTRRLQRVARGAVLDLHQRGFTFSDLQHCALSHCPKCRAPLTPSGIDFRTGMERKT